MGKSKHFLQFSDLYLSHNTNKFHMPLDRKAKNSQTVHEQRNECMAGRRTQWKTLVFASAGEMIKQTEYNISAG